MLIQTLSVCCCWTQYIDEYCLLQKLKHTESDRLSVQVNAYLDNMIDVATLLEDSDTKSAALDKVAELEESLSRVSNTIPSHSRICEHLIHAAEIKLPPARRNVILAL